MPWANGRGTSYEIASDRNEAGEWTWRLAMAPVNEDGPFSRIECVNRSLAVVEGAGMLLSVDRKKLQCLPMQVVRFRGDAITEAVLTDGPIMDINLMVRRKEADGEMAIVSDAGLLNGASIVVAVGGSAQVMDGESTIDLECHDSILECDSETISLISGTVCVVSVKRL
jgi:environmental stress-induced protein Ves